MHHDIEEQSYISATERKSSRTNESYSNNYQDLPTVIELKIPKMEHLLRRTIKSVLAWREHWKGEL